MKCVKKMMRRVWMNLMVSMVWAGVCAGVCMFLTSCAPLLERRYVTAEPHSSKFWESEVSGTLRAENHQDIVNDLLLLIDRHTESATLRLYHFDDESTVADTLENAAMEIQQQTPLGSYAVSYITSSSQEQRGYYEIKVQIGYRRTAEQLRNIVNATSAEAVYSLLKEAYEQGNPELAVRIGYWGTSSPGQVEEALGRLRQDRAAREHSTENGERSTENEEFSAENDEMSGEESENERAEPETFDEEMETSGGEFENWPVVQYYPESGTVGLIEFLLEVREDLPEDVREDTAENTPENLPENQGENESKDAAEQGDLPEDEQTPSGATDGADYDF